MTSPRSSEPDPGRETASVARLLVLLAGAAGLLGPGPRPLSALLLLGAVTGLLALALGWLLLVQGVPDVDVLWTADVATAGPGWLGRIAVCLLVALGAGLVAGGLVAAGSGAGAAPARG